MGNPGPGGGKCHRRTQHFQMIVLRPAEGLELCFAGRAHALSPGTDGRVLGPAIQSSRQGGLKLRPHHCSSPTDLGGCLHLTSWPGMETT